MFIYLLAKKKCSLTVWWRDNVHLPSGPEKNVHLLFGEEIMFTYLLAQEKKSSLTVWWRDNVHLPSGQEIFFHLLFGEKIMFIYLLAKKIKLHLLFGEEIMFIYFLAKKKSSLTVWWRESPQKGEPAHATFLQTQMLKKKDNGKTKTLRL